MSSLGENSNKAVLCIGSNREPKISNVEKGLRNIRRLLTNVSSSEIYETPEIYGKGAPYANAVVSGDTICGLDELNHILKQLELNAGRDAEARNKGEVPLDIDIVMWNGSVIREKDFRQSFFQIGFKFLREENKAGILWNTEVHCSLHNNE